MDECWANWLSELESDDSGFYDKSEMNPTDGEWLQSTRDVGLQDPDELNKQSDSHSSNNTTICHPSSNIAGSSSMSDSSCVKRPAKVIKRGGSPPSSYILCFDNCDSSATIPFETGTPPANVSSSKLSIKSQIPKPRTRTPDAKRPHSPVERNSRRSADHIMTERLRRERITCKFIELSALIPGLKKTDKSSVLSDAINYVKHLKDRVQLLEEQNKKGTIDAVVETVKPQRSTDEASDTYSISGEANSELTSEQDSSNDTALEVEARVSERDVLIRVHCRRERGVLNCILTEIEKLHLTPVHSTAFPFGCVNIEVRIIAQMDHEFNVTVKDLAKMIREKLLRWHV